MKNESKIYCCCRKALKRIRLLDVLLFALILVTIYSAPLLIHNYFSIKLDTLGVYGDFFGSLNSLVSALAFAGLIISLYYQRKDLKMQRQELELTRAEMQRQAEAQEKSALEQANQAKLIEEQINKDIRPYINAYWEIRNSDIVLAIKNIGKCACSDFKVTCGVINAEKLNTDYKAALNDLVTRIQNLNISIFPSSIDYSIGLTNYGSKVSDINFFEELKQCNVLLICDFIFVFRGRSEPFKITYDFGTMELFENENLKFHKDMVNELQKIGKS